MKAFEILKFANKYFPLHRPEETSFVDYYNSILDDYCTTVIESQDLFDSFVDQNSYYVGLGRETFIEEFKEFSELIKQSIHLHLLGLPSVAYDRLKEAMDKTKNEDGKYKYIGGSTIVSGGSYQFYRLRRSSSRRALHRQELFHVPFSLRRKIHTKRFSIPGLPSLYLSNSIYVAWEELDRPKLEDVQAVRLELAQHFDNLNLTTEMYYNSELPTLYEKQNDGYDKALSAVFLFPLVLACSIKVNDPTDVFRPEYIVPQMMLQWVTMNIDFIGICYTSSHVDITNTNFKGRFRNYVIPSMQHEGEFCTKLKRMFTMTEPLSAELYELNRNPNPPTQLGGSTIHSNNQIESIEIINGQKREYGYTKFGYLEKALGELETSKIDF